MQVATKLKATAAIIKSKSIAHVMIQKRGGAKTVCLAAYPTPKRSCSKSCLTGRKPMPKVIVQPAFHIRLTYSGHGQYTASWYRAQGNLVRRTIHINQWSDTRAAALEAAELFVAHCNANLSTPRTFYETLNTVTLSYIGADRHAVAVTTRARAVDTEEAA